MPKRKDVDACSRATTFTFEGNLASFFPKTKQHASLMLHLGAKIEGTGDTGRSLKIGSVAEANAAKNDIEKIVRAWIEWRSDAKAKPAKKKTSAKQKTAAKKKK